MQKQDMPMPPKNFLKLIGPGLVLIAMGLGSGEFVLWPYLATQFGLGILWGALVGILFQYFVSNETGRYTLITGNSVFTGFKKLSKFFPAWFIVSTFLSFGWPGIIATGGEILGRLLNISDYKWLTILMLISIGLIFSFGGKVYSTLENIQKVFLLISIPIILLIAALVIQPETILEISKGLIGIGQNYLFFPAGIVLGQFLGAIAYSGAGGNLILSHSFYIQDKKLGMAFYGQGEINKKDNNLAKEVSHELQLNQENIKRFKKWFSVVAREQFFSFAVIGLLTIILLAVISYKLLYPLVASNDIEFIFLEASKLSLIAPVFGSILLILGVTFLYTTQLGVFESTSRIMSENLHLASKYFAKIPRSKLFFLFLWLQIVFGVIIAFLNIATPLQILFLNTTFSAISMFILSGSILWLNTSNNIPKELRPGIFRKLMLLISFIFFGIFSFIVVIEAI
jgi:hypothetical protein